MASGKVKPYLCVVCGQEVLCGQWIEIPGRKPEENFAICHVCRRILSEKEAEIQDEAKAKFTEWLVEWIKPDKKKKRLRHFVNWRGVRMYSRTEGL